MKSVSKTASITNQARRRLSSQLFRALISLSSLASTLCSRGHLWVVPHTSIKAGNTRGDPDPHKTFDRLEVKKRESLKFGR